MAGPAAGPTLTAPRPASSLDRARPRTRHPPSAEADPLLSRVGGRAVRATGVSVGPGGWKRTAMAWTRRSPAASSAPAWHRCLGCAAKVIPTSRGHLRHLILD